ncbi:MAG: hypothetical protein V4727_13015 [Verrucomicrobiota bacterium]
MTALAALTLIGGIMAIWKARDPIKGRQYCWAYGYFYMFTIAFAFFYHCYIQWTIQEELIHVLIAEGRSENYEDVLTDGLRSLAVSAMFSCITIALGAVFGLISVLRIREGNQVVALKEEA